MALQIFRRCDERESFLVVVRLANEVIEKFGTLVPPMAEKFRVVRRHNDGRAVEGVGETLKLRNARGQKMAGMFVGSANCGGPVIYLFRSRAARDRVVLDPGKAPRN